MTIDNSISRRDFLKIASILALSACSPKSTFEVKETDEVLAIPQGHILLRDSTTGADDLWVVKSDGSSPRRLTKDYYWEEQGVFSPDGKSIAYTRFIPSGDGLTEVGVWRNGNIAVVSPHREKWHSGISWSANSRYLSFARRDINKSPAGVVVVDTLTGKNEVLEEGIEARWSKVGSNLALVTKKEMQVLDYTTGALKENIPKAKHPFWSTDYLYFDIDSDIRTIYKESLGTKYVEPVIRNAWEPKVSPSDRFLLYNFDINYPDANRVFDLTTNSTLPGNFPYRKWVKGDILMSYKPIDGAIYANPLKNVYKQINFAHSGSPLDFSTNFQI